MAAGRGVVALSCLLLLIGTEAVRQQQNNSASDGPEGGGNESDSSSLADIGIEKGPLPKTLFCCCGEAAACKSLGENDDFVGIEITSSNEIVAGKKCCVISDKWRCLKTGFAARFQQPWLFPKMLNSFPLVDKVTIFNQGSQEAQSECAVEEHYKIA